jgi:hypothetical protein
MATKRFVIGVATTLLGAFVEFCAPRGYRDQGQR